nr:hypothetical protein [Tanacetum cinerariifolium]
MLPVTQIDTFYNGLTLKHRETINAAVGGTFMKRRPEECYDLIENMTAHHNDWDTSAQRRIKETIILKGITRERTSSSKELTKPQVVTTNEFTNFMKANDAILKNMQTNMTSLTNSNLELKNMLGQFMKINTASSLGSGTLLSNTISNPKEDLKGITTRRGTAYPGPTIPTTSSSPVVAHETKATKDTVHPTNNESTKDVQPSVVLTESLILNSKPVISPIIEPVASPISASKPNQRHSIPYPSRLQDQKLRDKEVLSFSDVIVSGNPTPYFDPIISTTSSTLTPFGDSDSFSKNFADALILMPKFGPSIKSLLTNKDKLCELARTPLNEHCSAVLLKKLPEKQADPGKFLIQYDFPRMAECLALADLDGSINRMPISVWNTLSLSDLSPTCMTLELTNRLISRPVRVAEDFFVKVEVNEFLALKDDHTSPEVNQSYVDTEGGILLLEAFLNDDPSLPPPNQGNYLPEVRKELKICDTKFDKSSIDEPPEVEIKDLHPHLKYVFLEGDDKLPVIIAKDLSVEELTVFIMVIKSHKRAFA